MGFADPSKAEHLITAELGLELAPAQAAGPGRPHGAGPAEASDAGDLAGADAGLLAALAAAADPDLALSGLATLVQRCGPALAAELIAALRGELGLRNRLTAVLGVSAALSDHLARHPDDWRTLRGPDALRRPTAVELRSALLAAVGAEPYDAAPVAGSGSGAAGSGAPGSDQATALRVAYRRRLLHLAARDLTGTTAVEDVMAELADLAAGALEAALAIARSQFPGRPASLPCRLAVIAMGKCGGRELNYVSDVDVIFVAEAVDGTDGADERDALATATKLASAMMRVCSQSTPEGPLWQVDANLRPEGRSGPLVRTLASHRAYYERWAKTWEFQALLKARPIAGDLELGAAYMELIAPMVWRAAQSEHFVEDVQTMRRRVEETVRRDEAGRQLKLGPGGLRDIEFAVQLLQLVHGRTDEGLRSPATLAALAALSRGGYVGRDDAADLAAAYRFLRRVEHLLQLRHLRRTHVVPPETDTAARRGLGRALRAYQPSGGPGAGAPDRDGASGGNRPGPGGASRRDASRRDASRRDASRRDASPSGTTLPSWPGPPRPLHQETSFASTAKGGQSAGGADPAAEFAAEWRRHALAARRLHEKLFYRPLLRAVARLPGDAARLTPAAARARLEALGYEDPAGALRHIEALTAGVSRRAAIQRTLLPVMLGWFADAAQPDAGLLAFRQVSDELGETPWYLRLLRDEAQVAERMAQVLASSRYATGLLLREPEAVMLLADDADLVPRPRDALTAEALAAVRRHDNAEDAVAAVRGLRRRELMRTAVASLLGRSDVEETGEALTTVTAVTITAALQAAVRKIELELRGPFPTRMCIVAMGRFGGHEVGYASDADVMFVHEPLPGAGEGEATRAAHAAAQEVRRLLARPAPDPPLHIDPDLRPEGRQGPLVRTLDSYAAYYRRWSAPWESQALLRAEPVAGDPRVGERFVALADGLRYPDGGIDRAAVREIRRIKARIEAERLPRGADPLGHLKLGRGGLADVEWVVQLLQLRHAHARAGLRTTRTLAALSAAAEAGLVARADADVLAAAWRLATRIRDAVMLVRGRPGDTLPTAGRELAAVARVLGYGPGESGRLLDDHRRAARRARAVMERLFYD
jgi:[glutamine synthetase] adenylyltransferase / [glutamine synthetase]-adenylyl-L-tyrosine phosphorylase